MPQQLGKYALDELIAVGGMAEIYRARVSGLGGVEKVVAVKRLHEHYCSDSDFVNMLVNEARIAVQLNHKNIAQVFDLEHEGDDYFIAMEFIHGRDLHRVIRRFAEAGQAMPIEAAVYVVQELCSGLSYAHRKADAHGIPLNIIHRDISPQNVLISFEGEVKIVDFGIAKAAKRASVTQSGVIKGKFYYMSPEQARGDRLDQRTDIFSVGSILYEMITGRMLYEGADDTRLVHRARRADFTPPRAIFPDIPEQLEAIIIKALSRDVRQRFETARDMQLALTAYSHSIGSPFDSVMLSEMMHSAFETGADASSAVYHVADEDAYGRPDYRSESDGHEAVHPLLDVDSGTNQAHGYPGPISPNSTELRWPLPGAPTAEEDETSVYQRAIVDDIIDELQESRSRDGLRRAALPSRPRPVNVEIDNGVYRSETVITGHPSEPSQIRPHREGPPPTALFMMAIGGVLLLAWAFIFATNNMVLGSSADAAQESGPRIQASADESSAFRVRSDPTGARVIVDGEESGLRTPAVLTNITPGSHRIELVLPYHEKGVYDALVEEQGVLDVTLEPKRGILKIDSRPPGAAIHVDGEPAGRAPVHLDGQIMRDAHRVAASLPGHTDVVKTVRWENEETVFAIELTLTESDLEFGDAMDGLLDGAVPAVLGTSKALEAEAETSDAPPQVVADGATENAVSHNTNTRRSRRSTRRARRRRTSSGGTGNSTKGMISVNSKPPGEVFVDGRSIDRSTPIRGMTVSSGYHRVKVFYPKTNSYSSEKRPLIKPGTEVKLFFRQ